MWRRINRESSGYRLHTLGLLLIELIATPLFLLAPVPLALVVDSFLGGKALPGWLDAVVPDGLSPGGVLLLAALLQVVAVLITDLQSVSSSVVRTHTFEQLTLGMRSRLFAHLQRLSFSFHDQRGSADSLYRLQYDAQALGWVLVDHLVPMLAAALTLVSVFVVVVNIDVALSLVALAVMPVLVILAATSKDHLRRHYRSSARLESDAMGVLHEVLGSFRVVKAFGREAAEHRRFLDKGNLSAKTKVALSIREGMLGLAVNLTISVGTGLVLYVGANRVRDGNISLGELLIVLNYLARLYDPLKVIAKQITGLQRSYESLERSFEVLDEEPDVREHPDARPLVHAQGAIELRSVCFGYSRDDPVLQDVSLIVPAGTRVGVVGRTGAGKTTLVSLLLRFYDVDSGAVLLDGVDVREYRIDDLRSQFAMVLQEPVLFATTIRENIAYGRPGASIEEIRSAAEMAGADAFISALSEGYDTLVGERGQRLSGGERQRISLARAFLKDAPILLLDEPTSSVDTRTEAGIMAAMQRLMEGRTTFMIAHRLSTLDSCDLVVSVNDTHLSVVSERGASQSVAS